jgi:hypothetical protein
MAILPKAIYVFNAIPIKIQMTFITDFKMYPKVHLETQKTMNSKGNTEQKEQCWRYHNNQLQTILQTTEIKTAGYWHKNRYEQWNRIEDWDMNSYSYAHLIFDKCAKNL